MSPLTAVVVRAFTWSALKAWTSSLDRPTSAEAVRELTCVVVKAEICVTARFDAAVELSFAIWVVENLLASIASRSAWPSELICWVVRDWT